MVIGERLKELRKQEPISQGDVEKRTGLLRCYISRVEKPDISFARAESVRNTKQEASFAHCEGIVAPNR
jgi:transcriptional regulator with XRE-family HTH domain